MNIKLHFLFGGESLAIIISLTTGAINVNTLNRGSAIAVGEVSQPGWNITGKTNFGNGQLFGRNFESQFVTNLYDNDYIDSPIYESQPSIAPQNQTG
ncbi:hypothetical protein [Paenibacillus elgii]|uniref:hypothetical protein n=1 Tax=Paenibacillus elgii TaxID=189691 RepID=UPI000248C5CB|nr:hypothetical protein [Paenibacillus elgii]